MENYMVLKSCKQKFPPIGDTAERNTTKEMFCCGLLSKTGIGWDFVPGDVLMARYLKTINKMGGTP